ncbi:hypothetical protein [Eikenella longinqua]|uniref:hypothetical protein n=1 Tax=Eikenella longinqua TaxID=1795827 RepID=UPI000ACCC821|nr:hypothetical protein [Eikenella longinqua]
MKPTELNKMILDLKVWIKYQRNKISTTINPYTYEQGKYTDSFLSNFPKRELITIRFESIPRVIYSFWTGDNPMSPARSQHFQLLKKNADIEVALITPQNLSDFILPAYPLHPAFPYLSLVHKSDYLRCYFMHHYGGGYSDVKATKHSWENCFHRLENSNAYFLGYPEVKKEDLTLIGGILGNDMKSCFSRIAGNGAYIFKKQTPFTQEWYTELHRRMDNYTEQLIKHPGNILGDNYGYPIPWFNILGDIFHPLCLKYHERILLDSKIRPCTHNYR